MHIIIILVCLILCFYFGYCNKKLNQNVKSNDSEKPIKLDKLFYSPNEVSKQLVSININKNAILNETIQVYQEVWTDWPEKELYEKNSKFDKWQIFPFYAFGTWVNINCQKCPTIYNFIKKLKGLKLATLSKLTPGMKLSAHRGWASHSNHVIRCHYGLIVPEKSCYIAVSNSEKSNYEIQYHKQFEWVIFDDSKWHWAENAGKTDRIVLIIDIERPDNIETGTSNVGDSKELINIVEYFRQNNISTNYNLKS